MSLRVFSSISGRMDLMTSSPTAGSGSITSHLLGTSTATTPVDSFTMARRRDVSRVLFQSPDSRSDDYARDKLRAIHLEDTRKYNFDFEKEVPLEGRWQWEPVGISPGCSPSLPTTSALSSRLMPSTSASASSISSDTSSQFQDSLLIIRPASSGSTSSVLRYPGTLLNSISQEPVSIHDSSTSPVSIPSDNVEEDLSIPSSVPVESSLESSEDDAIVPNLLKTDSSTITTRTKSKQGKLNKMFPEVRKRQAGTAATVTGKKKPRFQSKSVNNQS